MTNEEVMALMFDMGIHDSLEKENWIPDNAWVLFANRVAAAERERIATKFMQIHNAQQHRNNYFAFAARVIREEV